MTPTPRRPAALAAALAALCLAALSGPALATAGERLAGSGAPPPARAAAFPRPAGWQAAGEILDLGPDDLWRHINGAADQFLAYGFRNLREGELAAGEARVTVGIYDMGDPLNAFGIYAAERSPDRADLGVGAASQASPPWQWLLLKDRFYVKVDKLAGDLPEADGAALLAALAGGLPGGDSLPAAFDALPAERRVPASEGFTRAAFLGLDELARCVHAEYAGEDGAAWTVFLMLPEGDEAPADLLDGLGDAWRKGKGRAGKRARVREVPYRGLVAVRAADGGLLGVTGLDSERDLLEALGAGR